MGTGIFEEIKKSVENDKLYLIAYYGASTTSHEYIFPNWGDIIRYVLKYQLEQILNDWKKPLWNIHTINLGLDGATSSDLYSRFDDIVLSLNPNLIFLEEGKNDMYFNIDKKITETNKKKTIRKALDKGIKVVFISTIPSLSESLNKKIRENMKVDLNVAREFKDNKNFSFVNLFELFPKNLIKKSYTLISEDGNDVIGISKGEIDPIHYNKYGNAIVAKILLKQVFGIDFNENAFLKDLENQSKQFPNY